MRYNGSCLGSALMLLVIIWIIENLWVCVGIIVALPVACLIVYLLALGLVAVLRLCGVRTPTEEAAERLQQRPHGRELSALLRRMEGEFYKEPEADKRKLDALSERALANDLPQPKRVSAQLAVLGYRSAKVTILKGCRAFIASSPRSFGVILGRLDRQGVIVSLQHVPSMHPGTNPYVRTSVWANIEIGDYGVPDPLEKKYPGVPRAYVVEDSLVCGYRCMAQRAIFASRRDYRFWNRSLNSCPNQPLYDDPESEPFQGPDPETTFLP